MTDAARLDAILARLGDLETSSAAAHAGIAGGIDRLGDRVDVLAERQAAANGRTGKLENVVGEQRGVVARQAAILVRVRVEHGLRWASWLRAASVARA